MWSGVERERESDKVREQQIADGEEPLPSPMPKGEEPLSSPVPEREEQLSSPVPDGDELPPTYMGMKEEEELRSTSTTPVQQSGACESVTSTLAPIMSGPLVAGSSSQVTCPAPPVTCPSLYLFILRMPLVLIATTTLTLLIFGLMFQSDEYQTSPFPDEVLHERIFHVSFLSVL